MCENKRWILSSFSELNDLYTSYLLKCIIISVALTAN